MSSQPSKSSSGTTRCALPPSASTTNIFELFGKSTLNAILFPSGDQRGLLADDDGEPQHNRVLRMFRLVFFGREQDGSSLETSFT